MYRQNLTAGRLARLAAVSTLAVSWLCLPPRSLAQSTDAQTGVPSLDDLQKRLNELKAEQNRRQQEHQHRAPPAPSFTGTWELVRSSLNGVTQELHSVRLSITQDGSVVRIGNQEHRLTSPNTVIYQQYYVHDDRYGHQVQSADQADLVDTISFRVNGSKLTAQTVNYCKANYYACPAGRKTVGVREFRRVAQ